MAPLIRRALSVDPGHARFNAILYANRAMAEAVGASHAGQLEAWQLTPRAVPKASAAMTDGVLPAHGGHSVQGERDLPRVPIPAAGALPPLPAPTKSHTVLVQDAMGVQRSLLSMHRVPFWVADSTSVQHAAVMYIGC